MEVGKSIPGKARSLVVDSLVPASRWAAAAVHGCSEAGREMSSHVRRSVVRNGSMRRMRWVRHRVAVTGMSWMLIVRTVVRVRRRCVHRTRRCPRALVRVAIARTCVHLRLVVSVSVARRAHGRASDSRNGTLFLNGRFRVHALFWADVAKLRVVGRLHKML